MGGEIVAPQSFMSLKKSFKTFNFCSNAPSPDLIGLLFRYDHPGKEKDESAIFLLVKMQNCIFLHIGTCTVGFSDKLNLVV